MLRLNARKFFGNRACENEADICLCIVLIDMNSFLFNLVR